MRLAEAVRVTPPPLWFVLILGAFLTVGWIVLGADRRGSFIVQACAVGSVGRYGDREPAAGVVPGPPLRK